MALTTNGLRRTGTGRNDIGYVSTMDYNTSYNILRRTGTGRNNIEWTNINTGSDTSGVTAGTGDVLTGKYFVNSSGTRVQGTMANQGAKTASLNCGSSYTIPKGYHSGSGKVTANSLSSQTSANATAATIRSGYTAWVNGSKITGTMAVQSALSFSAAATSHNTIRIQWKNPAKGPWNGVFIQRSTSGYPGSSGGTRVYNGTGSNKGANATSYVDLTGLSSNTTYYFTCTSYADPLPWGSSYNVSAKTSAPPTFQSVAQRYIDAGYLRLGMFNCRSASGLTPLKIAWTTSDKTYTSAYKSTKPHISNGNTIYFASDYYLNDDCYIPSGTGTSGITWNRIPANNGTCSLVLHLGPRVLIEDSSWTDTYRPDLYEAYVNIKNFISNSTLTVQSTGYNDTNENNWTDKWENISLSIGTTLHCGNNAFQDWTNYSGTCWKRSDFDQQTILEIIVHFPYVHNAGGFNFIRNGKFVFNYRG